MGTKTRSMTRDERRSKLCARWKKNHHHHHDDDEDDEDDEENDDRDDDDDEKGGGEGPFGCSSKDHHRRNDGKKKNHSSVGDAEKTWAFKASSSLQYAHMPTHATHEDVVVLAFQGAKRSEGQANQRIYLVRSEDGGRTFDSRNPKKLNALVVQTVNGGEKKSFFSESDDAHVEAQWGPALFKDEEENGTGGKRERFPSYVCTTRKANRASFADAETTAVWTRKNTLPGREPLRTRVEGFRHDVVETENDIKGKGKET